MSVSVPDLTYLIAIAREGSITGAAESCHVSQQAMSSYLKRLEETFHTVLFTRRPAFKLTREGNALLKYAYEIQTLEEQLQNNLNTLKGINSRIQIGVASPMGRSIFHTVPLLEITRHCPDIHISVIEDDYVRLLPPLREGYFDFVIAPSFILREEFQQMRLGTIQQFVLLREQMLKDLYGEALPAAVSRCSKGVNLLEFAGYPRIPHRTTGSISNQISSFFYKNNVQDVTLGAINNSYAIMQALAVQNAWGICADDTLPERTNSSFLLNGVNLFAFPIRVPDLSFPISLFWLKNRRTGRQFKTILEEFRRCVS